MRLKEIQKTKRRLCSTVQDFSKRDISRQIGEPSVVLPKEAVRRRIMRVIAEPALRWQQARIQRSMPLPLDIPFDFLCIEDRFGTDVSLARLLSRTRREHIGRVLVPGCYVGGDDVQFWLRRGVKELEGVDVYSLQERWDQITPRLASHFGARVHFQQASIEALPFPDDSFDLVCTSAVLEHVRNLRAMVEETARVLRPGGWAWHCFGPLYYAFGADHCIAAYGDAAGYDHLLLPEHEYQQRIRNQPFFDQHPDPNLPFWALNDQFSFATAREYLGEFERCFHFDQVVVKMTQKGLSYRRQFPGKWAELLNAGVAENDLLIKSMAVVLRKK